MFTITLVSVMLDQLMVARKKTEYSCKTKNMKTHKNFNNFIENKEVKCSNNWVCINVLILN